jgi:branched-chain amino acid transport system ATP-binding protein
VLLLDEVVAGLNPTETDLMIHLIRQMRDGGLTILMVEHVMRAVLGVSDRVIVLNFGDQIAEGTPQEVSANPQVVEAYLGRVSPRRKAPEKSKGAGAHGEKTIPG